MYEYKATIVRVVDGDTVDVDIDLGFDVWLRSQRIRLFGVDTPECRTRNKATKAHGLLAKAYVQKALIVGGTYALTNKREGKVWKVLGRDQDGKRTLLRNSSSKKNWLSRTPARIKKT